MNRSLWTATLSKYNAPAWPCPTCNNGILILDQKTVVYHETDCSKKEHREEYWAPEMTDFRFSAWLKCNYLGCGDVAVVSGGGGVECWQTCNAEGETETVESEYFTVNFISPTPNIFYLPKGCPDEAKIHLRAGFNLFFSDQSAAANRIRVALECLLDYLKIPRRRKDQSNKFIDLSLHKRIEHFTKNEPALGGQLMALKWLGNTASHEGNVSRNDLLDAFEILEHVLVELIDKRSAKVVELARKLTKKHARRK